MDAISVYVLRDNDENAVLAYTDDYNHEHIYIFTNHEAASAMSLQLGNCHVSDFNIVLR